MAFLQTQQLTKIVQTKSGKLTLLHDINLAIQQGDSTAIVGVSGAGKTTLLSILAGLEQPSSGKVIFAGQSLQNLSEEQRTHLRRGNVGFVFQQFHLVNTLTALENIMLPLEMLGKDDPRGQALHWCEQVGLANRCQHFAHQLSGGEQQRVAIARAFAVNPQCLFADEPTGNLDEKTAQTIIDTLFELNQRAGTTLVLVTHDKQIAERCQTVLQLDVGRLV